MHVFCKLSEEIVTSKGWKVQAVIAGTKSMNQGAWNKAMETIGVPKQKWDGTQMFCTVILLKFGEDIIQKSKRAT